MDTDNLNISCFLDGWEWRKCWPSNHVDGKSKLNFSWMQCFALFHGILWKSHESCESAARYSHVLSRRDHWHIHAYSMQIQKFKVVSVGPRRSEHLIWNKQKLHETAVFLFGWNTEMNLQYIYIYKHLQAFKWFPDVSGCFRQATSRKQTSDLLRKSGM